MGSLVQVEYKVRTMNLPSEEVNTDIGAESNTLTWMIEFASVLINRYLVGKDGKTAYESLKGKAPRCCSETVMFRRAGHQALAGEHVISGKNGVSEEERWDRAANEEVKFTPWMVKERSANWRRGTELPWTSRSARRYSWRSSCLQGARIRAPAGSTSRRRSSKSLVVLKGALVVQPPCSAEKASLTASSAARGWRSRWFTATRKIQEFVNMCGLKRKVQEPRGVRMNDGEDEKGDPVKKHARHEEGHMPGSSSTDQVPMQEQSAAAAVSTEAGPREALAAGR